MSVKAFEKSVAEYCGAAHAIAFNSGTSAMYAAYAAADTSPLDRVITSPNTHVGTITGAVLLGAMVQFGDIDLKTGHLALPGRLELASRGRYIYVPVHFAGTPMDMKELDLTITDPHAMVIEDAMGAFGATYNDGTRVGSCAKSDMTVFSFHKEQVVSTQEGGMVVTNINELAESLRAFRDNTGEKPTGNFAMSEMQAKRGSKQLKEIDAAIEARRAVMKVYREELGGLSGVQLLETTEGSVPSLAIVLTEVESVGEKPLPPLYCHPMFDEALAESFPSMQTFASKSRSLPMDADKAKSASETLCSLLDQSKP